MYFAFVTTAPAELDSPATMTLHAGAFADVAGLAADAIDAFREGTVCTCAGGSA